MIDQAPTTSTPPPDQRYGVPPPEAHRSKNRFWIWLIVLLVFAFVFWWVLHRQSESSSPAASRRSGMGGPVTLTVTTAANGDLGIYLTAIGTVTPVYTDSIVSQVAGQVVAVHYREGQLVRKGDPLVDIYAAPFAATLKQAEGNLERDTHLLEQEKMDLERYQAAWARNAIAKQQLDDQEKIVLQQQGVVKADEGAVEFDRVQLEYCHITAPITGKVGLRLVDPGNVVTANNGTTLAVITQLQPITVVFTISEDNLQQVLTQLHAKRALEVHALDRAQQKRLATGKLLTTDNLIDTTTGTVKLRAVFENKDNALFPNQFVNTRLLVDTLHNVTLIDASAIQHNGTQAFVWVIQNGAAQMRNITTGATDKNLTQVEGLNAGEVVADSSFEKLQNGAKVNIVKQVPGERKGSSQAPGSSSQAPGSGTQVPGSANQGAGSSTSSGSSTQGRGSENTSH